MIKVMKTGLAALIAATSMAAAATPAAAWGDDGYGGGYGQGYGGYGYGGEGYEHHHHDHDSAAPLIVGGILGLGLLAILASSSSHHNAQTQTETAYNYGDNSRTNYHPDVCTQRRQVWDSNRDAYVTRSYRVAC